MCGAVGGMMRCMVGGRGGVWLVVRVVQLVV